MKILKSVIVLCSLMGQTACASQRLVASSKELSMKELERQIKLLQDESQIPGLQVVVTEGKNTIFEYVNGIRAHGHSEAITSEDKWHIGSCTKPMTAFLIGRLVDEKVIDWNTTLGAIVPSDFEIDPTVKFITIEQLLLHSSGLADVTESDGGKLWPTLYTDKQSPQIMRDKLVRGIFKMPVRFPPGIKFEYSNSGYVVLGWIIEKMKSMSWEDFMKKEMFQKLGMTSCGFGPAGIENTKSPLQPWSHQLENNQIQSIAPGIYADNPPALGPAGTVHCGAKDWRKFLRLFVADEGSRSGYLTSATYNKLLSNAGEGPYTYSSIGRMERPWAKGAAFAMAGSNTMNYAIVAIAPNLNRIFTVNTNAGHPKAEESATKILKLLTEIK
jgi:CubicO group peptidase (beta-lactamase class C family)